MLSQCLIQNTPYPFRFRDTHQNQNVFEQIRSIRIYKKSAVLIFTYLFLASAASRAVKEDTASPEALIYRARLQAAGTPVLRQNPQQLNVLRVACYTTTP
jgi:hypothetical protein